MKQHSSYKVKAWTSTQVSWSLDLIWRSGSMQMCGHKPLHRFALLSTNRQRLSLASPPSAPTLGSCRTAWSTDPLCWNASWHPLADASKAWATKQIKADVHLGSVCALNTSENSCNRRSLHPRHGCSCGKGYPKAVWYFFIWTIQKKNDNKIRNTPIPNSNLYLDCVGKK